jgi:hypothetical protein
MKFGIRKPSIKRSISARTTGRVKRTVKSAINPLYGKKGTGVLRNPKKALSNKVYNKTSLSAFKGSTTGVGAIFIFPFYITYILLKWTFIGMFYMFKWLFYSFPAWIFKTIKQQSASKKSESFPINDASVE